MYFVSIIERKDYKKLFSGSLGYFWDRKSAINAVHRNVTDMHKTIYPYAVIERIEQGLFPVPKERMWFRWQEEKKGFYEMEDPGCNDKYPHNFSMALGVFGGENSIYEELSQKHIDKKRPNYFIAAINSKDRRLQRYGFFRNRENAFKAVLENWGNIHNDTNDFALIECIAPNILPVSLERIWFRWNDKEEKYCETEMPKKLNDYPFDYPLCI